jgi:ribosomal protein S18 acetylase RimI-like enzyme
MIEIRQMIESDLPAVRQLLEEYARWIGIDLSFQEFDDELANLPGKYAPPQGRLMIALHDGHLAGCAAIRPLENGICEMKRLYIRPSHRGFGIGKRLANCVVQEATGLGYRAMRLDTLPSMTEAQALYRGLGFIPIDAYYENPVSGAVYMELRLNRCIG